MDGHPRPWCQPAASAALELAERLRDRYRLASSLLARGDLALLRGEWDLAREVTERGLSMAPRAPVFLALRSLLEHELGDFQRGGAYLDRLLTRLHQIEPEPTLLYIYCALTVPAIARVTADPQHLDVARKAIEAVVSSPHATDLVRSIARSGLASVVVQLGDVVAAREHYEGLKSTAGQFTIHWSNDRLLGVLAQATGDSERGAAHFEDALATCRRAGSRPELARTCYDYVDALLQGERLREGKDSPGKEDVLRQAAEMLDQSLAISRELGMRPLLEKALSHRDSIA